ncbi:MAG: hypothetical protein WAV21_02015 [Minisyncoccia bacterium]
MPDEPKKVQIDPDFSPQYPNNKEAAKKLGLRYDPKRKTYVDPDGSSVLDRYGQRL